MACTCGDLDCKRQHPCLNDLEKQKCLYQEKYARLAARLTVNRLDKVESRVHDFYHDTKTKDRKYFDPVIVPLFGPFDPYEFPLTHFGIDSTRALIFRASVPTMEALGWEFKAGDVIVYQGADHEVLTVKRNPDTYFAQYDYTFEWLIATYIPNRGS